MSVNKLREMVEEGPGCRILLGIVMFLLLASFALTGNCGSLMGNQNSGQGQITPGEGIAEINGAKVSASVFQRVYDDSIKQYAQQGMTALPAFFEATIYNNAMEQAVNSTMLIELCKRENVSLDGDAIAKNLAEQTLQAFAGQKEAWITEKKLKPNATNAEFQALYLKLNKRSTDDILKQNTDLEQINKMLDGAQGDEVRASFANGLLIAHFKAKIPASDEDLKKTYNVFVGKKIVLKPEKHPGVDLVKKLEGIKKDIESGKLKFEDAMDAQSDEEPAKGKKIHDNTMEIDGTTASVDPSYAPVTSLKPGEMVVLNFPNSRDLYRLDMVRVDLPADFATKKEQYKNQYTETKAIDKMQKGIDGLKAEKGLIKWHNEAFRALYEYARFESDQKNFSLDPATRKATYEGFIETSKKINANDEMGKRIAAVVAYQSFEKIYSATPSAEQGALAERRIEVFGDYAQASNNVDLMLEVAGLCATMKQPEKLNDWLGRAIEGISGKFDENAKKAHDNISKRIDSEVKSKLLTAKMASELRAKLADWRTEKLDDDKFMAEEKAKADKQAAIDKAEADKLQREEAAQIEKEKAEAAKKPKAGK